MVIYSNVLFLFFYLFAFYTSVTRVSEYMLKGTTKVKNIAGHQFKMNYV